MICKKAALWNFAEFTGKQLCQSLFLQASACNFIKKENLGQVFYCENCEISKNTYSYRTLLVVASLFATSRMGKPCIINLKWWKIFRNKSVATILKREPKLKKDKKIKSLLQSEFYILFPLLKEAADWLLKCCKNRNFYYVLYSYYIKFYFDYIFHIYIMFSYIFIICVYVHYMFCNFVIYFYFHIIW